MTSQTLEGFFNSFDGRPTVDMSETEDAKPTLVGSQVASPEHQPADDESKAVTDVSTGHEETKSTADAQTSSFSAMASNAATSAASTASAAATGVKDSVFSMFGGGAKKERKVEEDDEKDEPSGSSNAKRGQGEDDVSIEISPHALVIF